jgi:mannitol/fructose-specific phosphotransferase system IIA component (Ntr-type)
MAKKLGNNELVTFEEMLLANSIQVDAAVQLMIKKGYFTKNEFFEMLKEVQAEYQSKAQ